MSIAEGLIHTLENPGQYGAGKVAEAISEVAGVITWGPTEKGNVYLGEDVAPIGSELLNGLGKLYLGNVALVDVVRPGDKPSTDELHLSLVGSPSALKVLLKPDALMLESRPGVPPDIFVPRPPEGKGTSDRRQVGSITVGWPPHKAFSSRSYFSVPNLSGWELYATEFYHAPEPEPEPEPVVPSEVATIRGRIREQALLVAPFGVDVDDLQRHYSAIRPERVERTGPLCATALSLGRLARAATSQANT